MTDTATALPTGLYFKDRAPAAVPLTGVSIAAEIHSFYARVVVAQRYVNREASPIEAVYLFPLDEGAAICGFEAVVDGTLVVGEIHEREKAFEIYDDAMQAGHGAFLLDEERADVFQASIGNLPPGKDVLVRLTYVTELAVDEGRVRFTIPTTVSPRYAPTEDRGGVGRPDADALNPPFAWTVPYGLNLSVHLLMPGPISVVESPSHPISLRLDGHEATVTLGQKDAALDRDFVLSIEAAGLDAPHALVERADDGAEAIGVAFAPKLPSATIPAEVIFVVDRSGSMGGTSIDEVRDALQLCLRSLTPGCRFNIVGFGSTFGSLFPESRPYDQAALDEATRHVAALAADLGGTEILDPLSFVLESKPNRRLARQVVVLTDGQVTNTDAVLRVASSHAATARIFTFGIGAGASHHLVRGLARAGRGTAEFIYPGERIEPKVLRQFARLLSPALTDVSLDWGDAAVTQMPSGIPPVFAGGRLLVYGFVKNGRPSSVRLTANAPDGAVTFDVPVPDAPAASGTTVSTLAARARIRELEEGSDWLSGRGSQQRERKGGSARREIITLSRRFGLMSRETSFVAVERRDTPVVGDVQLRKVPIALTSGWGAADRPARRMLNASMARGSMPSQRLTKGSASSSPLGLSLPGSGPIFREPGASAAGAFPARPPFGMRALVQLQLADGSWPFNREFAHIIERDLDDLRRRVTGGQGRLSEILQAWATALAIAWLQRHAAAFEDEWRMLAEKGLRWLDATSARPPAGGTWLDLAKRVV